MASALHQRYALSGSNAGAAELTDERLKDRVEAQWFAATVDRKAMKNLMKRSDTESLRHFGLWLGLLILSGIAAFLTWGTWWCVPAFAVYGVLYAASDHRAHELSHGTPFKTRWLNEWLYHLNGFMTLHEGFYWRWSHSRHHTHTIIVGRDPEIAVPRPPDIIGTILDLFFLKSGPIQIFNTVRHAFGNLTDDGGHFVPDSERSKVFWSSRIYVAIFVATGAACWAMGSILPAMFIVLPRFYGAPLTQMFNITQHAGLDEDVYDHRLNTRTFYTNPVYRFLYTNMNYHIEHHMFPMVPFYNLPKLHALIKDQCPPAYPSIWACYKEILPALLKQVKNPGYYVQRPLPAGIAPELGPRAIPAE